MVIEDNRKEIKSKARQFIEGVNDPIYILGTNKYGEATQKWLTNQSFPVTGFINDSLDNGNFNGIPVISLSKVPKNSYVINCIIEGRIIDGESNLMSIQPKGRIDYCSLQLCYSNELPEIDFLSNTHLAFETLNRYSWLYNILEDKQSKDALQKLTSFRLNRDIKFLVDFDFRIDKQYFENFFSLDRFPTFVDGGAFDGATSKQFAIVYPGYESISLFEPNKKMIEVAKRNLVDFKNVYYYPNGLWNKSEVLRFDDSLSSASKLSNKGTIEIETISLDSLALQKVSFLKLDIEGAEYNALIGSENMIKTNKPIIAVCVYHNQEDFIRIPELLLGYNPNYKVYLRHYTQGVFETVMYFV